MRPAKLILSLAITTTFLSAQSTTARPAFEVASVKLVKSNGTPPGFALQPRRTGGQFRWTTTLYYLTTYAYHLPGWQLSGVPSEQTFYTIEATTDDRATEADIRLMLQRLLADRFKMLAYKETKELPGYALVIAKTGQKLAVASGKGKSPPMPVYFKGKSPEAFEGISITSSEGLATKAITGRGVPLSKLAEELSASLDAFVLDQTGLPGLYYYGFRFADPTKPNGDAEGPSLSSALHDELGLRLENRKGPVEFLVVSHIEKIPSEN